METPLLGCLGILEVPSLSWVPHTSPVCSCSRYLGGMCGHGLQVGAGKDQWNFLGRLLWRQPSGSLLYPCLFFIHLATLWPLGCLSIREPQGFAQVLPMLVSHTLHGLSLWAGILFLHLHF